VRQQRTVHNGERLSTMQPNLKRSLMELCCPSSNTSSSTHRPMQVSLSQYDRTSRNGREMVTMSPRSELQATRSRSERGPGSRTRGVDRVRGGGSLHMTTSAQLRRQQLFQTVETNVDHNEEDDVRLRVKFGDRRTELT